jgi:hypothetical protein
MKKSFFLLVPAAFGLLMMSACSDDSSAAASNSNQSSCALNPSETGLEINCNGESYGFLKTSSKGVYGSCGAEALKDDSGYKLVCGGDSVGVVYNGIRGRNGENGTNGLPGPQGEQGANGSNGAPGASCRAEQVATGFDLYCGEEKVGTILNGSNGKQGIQGIQGYSCSVEETLSGATIECEDGTGAVITNGLNGENCTVSGLLQVEEDDESEFFGQTYNEITCDGEPFRLYNGTKGAKGDGCSAEKDTKTGVTTITCGDDEVQILDGKNGDNCSIAAILDDDDKPTGKALITCGTGTGKTTYEVSDGAAGKNGDNCSIGENLDEDDNPIPGTAKITCGTGANATTYIVKDGAQGDAGYSCSAASYDGYSKITCGSADGDVETIVLAAGYAYCGEEIIDSIYNTLTHACVGSTVKQRIALSNLCDGAELADGHLCYNNVQKDTNVYAICGTSLYEKNDQFCSAYNTIVNKCDGKVFDPATQYCEETGTEAPFTYTVTNIYSVCGTSLYDTRNLGCCGDATYNPTTHYCRSETEVTALSACTVDETTILYNPETHDCDDSGEEPVVTPKE